MEDKSFQGSQMHLRKSKGNEEVFNSQGIQQDLSSLSNGDAIHSDNQSNIQQLQSLNIYNLQQKFFNAEEHNQLSNQMKKNQSEEYIPVIDSAVFSTTKIKNKRGSGQENSFFNGQGQITQKRNSIRKQPSEVLSILSNQNLNFLNSNNPKNESNSQSSEFIQSQLASVNQGKANFQQSQQSFNEKKQQKRESILLNSNNSSINNINSNGMAVSQNNNNNQIINLQNLSNLQTNNITTNGINFKQESSFVNNMISARDLPNNNVLNTSLSNLKPVSNTNSTLNVQKMAQILQIQQQKEQAVSQIKKLNSIQSKKLMIQQQQEIQQRIVSSMINNKNTIQSNKLNNGQFSVINHSQINTEQKQNQNIEFDEIYAQSKEMINDLSSLKEKTVQKGKNVLQNIFRVSIMIISLNYFCLVDYLKKKKAISALGLVNFIFQIVSLLCNILIIQYFLLKIFKTLEGNAMSSTYIDITCLIFGQLEVFFTFVFAQYDSQAMKIIYSSSEISKKNFTQHSQYLILLFDLLCFLVVLLEIIWSIVDFSINSALLNIIRSLMLFKLLRILSSLSALHSHFFKRQYYYQYEMFRILTTATLLILTFTNLWCALASYYFQVANMQEFQILITANIPNDDYNQQFLFFLNKVIENTFSIYTTLESDDKHFEQTFLISLQHIFIGVFYIHMFQSFFTLSKTICEFNRKKRQTQIDLIEYSKKINLEDSILDQSILYISNLPDNPNKYSNFNSHTEALKILPRSFKNQIEEYFEELLFDQIPFLSQFQTSLKNKIYSQIEEITYLPDEQIITEGQIDDSSLYFIIEGEAKVFYQQKLDSKAFHTFKTLKKLDYFGEISFLTGQPRKASVKSIGYLTVIKIQRKTLINLIQHHILDYQAFCMMRDQIMNNQNYSFINLKCYICDQHTHLASVCPFAHYRMDLVSYVKAYYLDSKDQVRQSFERKKKNSIKAVTCLKKIQRAVSGILEDTLIQGILSEDYSSDLQFDEEEFDKKIYYDSILLSLEFSEQEKENNLQNNLSKRPPSQIHVSNLPMTPDRRTSSKQNVKNGSLVASVEEDIESGLNSNMNNEIVFSSSSINNKILLKSKTNPKEEKNSPKHRASKGKSVSIQKADSLTNQGGSRYSRSHFHQPVTLSSISHKSSKEKDEIPYFLSRDDLSEKVFNFAAYFPDSNAKSIIESFNKSIKLNSKNEIIFKQGSLSSQNFDFPNQLSSIQNQVIGSQFQKQLSFYSVPNYGQSIQNYQQAQREHQEKVHRKLIDQINNNNFISYIDNEELFFN
ncbi:cyclic nucleotide-binding domain protein (macronuclear) [Tetrahymena thermophila SB210]|uniref:Cyclic nucleotide-binding domain protein n=1 Tax=Tetrahymena thermophila (strain SB210) TaxID=312017 RepID=I7LWV4_TETTS|nr:cyclic nucleotide-binding domain protein [Tetrahymena thermophila SB210]EAS02929.2 cyclic nucleotide-binding domain protein [Tetrahymena thermophila SB210]|eukprot:XP_001023174.2 cyclic nucleotide-binding domain protein [Tetrahymena thermophila SB210]